LHIVFLISFPPIQRGVHLGDQDEAFVSKHSHVSFRKTKDKVEKNDQVMPSDFFHFY